MTCKEVVGAVAQISVENDVDMALENSVHSTTGLAKLKEPHLMGPFGAQLVRVSPGLQPDPGYRVARPCIL